MIFLMSKPNLTSPIKKSPKIWKIFGILCLILWGFCLYQFSIKNKSTQPHQTIHTTPQISTPIQAENYQEFWLWTPPKHPEKLKNATTLYLLQGEIRSIRSTNIATLTAQGLGVRALKDKKIWLVFRANQQNWSSDVLPQILTKIQRWENAGNHVLGVQIDFDSPTYQLDNYVTLLKSVRKQLPSRYQLSVTGLLDWANQAENPQFLELGRTVNELVMQTYQGTQTLENYPQYLKKLQTVPFNFKVGIVENGQWQGADYLENNPNFNGYVVFLL